MLDKKLFSVTPVMFLAGIFIGAPLWAAQNNTFFDSQTLNEPLYLLFVLIALSLLPFIAIMMTSFTKIVVVLSIARQALGTAQTPPNIVIISLSMILTIFSMYPVLTTISQGLSSHNLDKLDQKSLQIVLDESKGPIKNFMLTTTHEKDLELFHGILHSSNQTIEKSDFIVLGPAFLISQLTQAFQIGFLIYLPFLVIDMTIANLLMALGMQMLSPTTISLPFKILLFVLVDGWRLLAEGLIKG